MSFGLEQTHPNPTALVGLCSPNCLFSAWLNRYPKPQNRPSENRLSDGLKYCLDTQKSRRRVCGTATHAFAEYYGQHTFRFFKQTRFGSYSKQYPSPTAPVGLCSPNCLFSAWLNRYPKPQNRPSENRLSDGLKYCLDTQKSRRRVCGTATHAFAEYSAYMV
ncbi:hypothetical protein [Kingella potus]|uniref:hypothetical protein n=1 Tax=Kingella potus TaxID=265175 RepID=UPI001FD0DCE0|nr:hypothetical protein [Kingella potus]UOP00094.1 hypothetical protein LVJ84_08950 [Kingella potus]